MKILVIGSEGFLGRQVVRYFRSKAHEVACADIVAQGTQAVYHRVDPDQVDFGKILDSVQPEAVINCAGAAHVSNSITDPFTDFDLNNILLFRLLLAIKEHAPSGKFVNFSSAAVYGDPTRVPIVESETLAPISPYGFHKKMSEDICREFASIYRIKTCSLRIFSAYGPGLRKQLFWDIYQKSLGANDIELHGEGNESRDFIFASDVAKCIEILLAKAPFEGESYNVASGVETKISDAVGLFLQELGFAGNWHFNQQNKSGYPKNWRADISKIKQLGFSPEVSLEAGLKQYVQWLRDPQ